ncbi:unnamed protein product [Nesidiocoris tenuis]|uniref:Uncharacterized protein n=1 Tax=Nesidiocoris tenuis TaxID=355587 RepID=A0A6H5H1W7_9HEMI|nr:unnamed protein product [Nesidiocoris tenuis]
MMLSTCDSISHVDSPSGSRDSRTPCCQFLPPGDFMAHNYRKIEFPDCTDQLPKSASIFMLFSSLSLLKWACSRIPCVGPPKPSKTRLNCVGIPRYQRKPTFFRIQKWITLVIRKGPKAEG